MDVVTTCPLRVSSVVWRPNAGAFGLTVVCKATYRLVPGESPLARDQDTVHEADGHWDDDTARSLHVASDLAPFKLRGDVLLVGSAFAPHGQPVSSLVARMIVAGVDKSIAVIGDRAWTQDGRLREGSRFTKMPLQWERAAGGPGTTNPAGVRPDAPLDAYGARALPNLEPPGHHTARPGDFIEPRGFGPIAPTWPTRVASLHHHTSTWDPATWNERPLPADLDPRYFNAAPPDQQVDQLRSDERIVLENLHPDHPRLVTNLARVMPHAVLERAGAPATEIALRCDTLTIDTDRGVCSLVFRGQIWLVHPAESGRVVVTMEGETTIDEITDVTAPISMWDTKAVLPFALGPSHLQFKRAGAMPVPDASAPDFEFAQSCAVDPPTADDPPLEPPRPQSTARDTLVGPLPAPSGDILPFGAPRTPIPPPVPDAPLVVPRVITFGPPPPMPVFPSATPPPVVPQAISFGLPPPAIAPPAIAPPAIAPPAIAPPAIAPPAIAPPAIAPLAIAPPAIAPPAIAPPAIAPPAIAPPAVAPVPEPALPVAPPEEPPMIGPLATPEMVARAESPVVEAPAPDPAPPPPPPPVPAGPPPLPLDKFPIERCAAIAASLARRRAEEASILAENEISRATWDALDKHWTEAIKVEGRRGKIDLLKAHDRAYVGQLEKERGPIGVDEYARLSVASERGTVFEVLANLTLPKGAAMRIERVWVDRIGEDPALGESVRAAVEAERAA